MINDVRNTVLAILNKDNNGYITPEEFNLFAKQAQLEIFEQYFHDYSRSSIKRNNRLHKDSYGDIPKRRQEVIQRFTSESVLTWDATQQRYIAPSDMYWLKDVFYNTTTPVELVSHSKARQLLSMLDVPPTTDYPIGVLYENTNPSYSASAQALQVYPVTITGAAQIVSDYIRYPQDPKWTYQGFSGGEPIFYQSASDYQDFELPVDDMENLVNKIVSYAAVSLREPGVIQDAMQKSDAEKQQEQ